MFRKLFGPASNAESSIERRLINETVEALIIMGVPTSEQAKSQAQDLLDLAKKGLQDAGEDDIHEIGNGDKIMALADRKPNLRNYIEKLYRHGVRRDDFLSWHNLAKIEQSFMLTQDKTLMIAMYRSLQSEGYSKEEALGLVTKAHVTYTADPKQIEQHNPDTFLPAELKLRVNEHRDHCLANDPERFKSELDNSSSFNSYIRYKLENKEL